MKKSFLLVISTMFSSYLYAITPNNPATLVLTPTKNSVTLNWTDSSDNETGFKLYRDDIFIKLLPPNITTYIDRSLSPNTDYRYTVKATDRALSSWIRSNPGAGGTIPMIGATASGMLVATGDLSGVYRSYDRGRNWQVLGEVNGLKSTQINCFGFHPKNGNIFYAGTGTGLYKTVDGGGYFDFISSNFYAGNTNNTFIEDISVSINKPKTLYVTYHEWDNNVSSDIVKSEDGGKTWRVLPLVEKSPRLRLIKLLVHPKNANVVYALSGKPRWGCSKARLYRSSDGGNNWNQINGILSGKDILDVDVDPNDTEIFYVSTFVSNPCPVKVYDEMGADDYIADETAGELYKVDHGTISMILAQSGIINAITSSNITIINSLKLASAWWLQWEDESVKKVGTWSSEDGGKNWSFVSSVLEWKMGPVLNRYYTFVSSYNGLSKTIIKDRLHPKRLYAASGWTYGSFDGGISFSPLATREVGQNSNQWHSTGLDNTVGHVLDVSDTNRNVIYMGGYDIGLWVSRDRGKSWKLSLPFKGVNDLKYPTRDGYFRYVWDISSDNSEEEAYRYQVGSNISTLLNDPEDEKIVWASFSRAQHQKDGKDDLNASCGLFKSVDYGEHWEHLTINGIDDNKHPRIYGLAIDTTTSPRKLYVTVNGDVYRSTDEGRGWSKFFSNGGLKFITLSGSTIYAGGEAGLYRYDGTWNSVGLDELKGVTPMLKDIVPTDDVFDKTETHIVTHAWNGIHDIKIDPSNPNRVYITVYGKNKGLYLFNNANASTTKLLKDDYARGVAIHPQKSNMVFFSSSQNYYSGGVAGASTGIRYSTDYGNVGSVWTDANDGMAWKYGGMMEIEKGSNPHIWAWTPGSGLQHALIK